MSNQHNQRGVDVGACGPAYPYNQFSQGCSVGPAVPQEALVRDGAIYQQCFVPFGIAFGVTNTGAMYANPNGFVGVGGIPTSADVPLGPVFESFPRNGVFSIFGVKFFNDPGEAALTLIGTGDNDTNQILAETDVAAWNTEDCFCPVNWGCISSTSPLRISATSLRSTGEIQWVKGVAWGVRAQSFGTCGPYGPGYGMPVPGFPGAPGAPGFPPQVDLDPNKQPALP